MKPQLEVGVLTSSQRSTCGRFHSLEYHSAASINESDHTVGHYRVKVGRGRYFKGKSLFLDTHEFNVELSFQKRENEHVLPGMLF